MQYQNQWQPSEGNQRAENMYYYKEIFGKLKLEIEGIWNGDEIIHLNGQVASKNKTLFNSHHKIEMANGCVIYIETATNLFLRRTAEIRLNHDTLKKQFIISRGDKPFNYWKKDGIKKLRELEITSALQDLKKAIKMHPLDAETYFYLACTYAIKENAKQAFESLVKAVEYHLLDREQIIIEGMLAFIRVHPAFESFAGSNYTELNRDLF